MLKAIAKLIKVLNSDAAPGQIGAAVGFSMIAGFTPFWSLHNLLVLFLVLVLRVNLSAFLLGLAVFSGLAFGLDPLFDKLGLWVLTSDSLNGLWTAMYNRTLWRVERFNNTVVMGSLLASLVLFFPLLLLSNLLIRQYRATVMAWVQRSRILQAIKASRFYGYYKTVSGWGRGDS
jgi:uncharacterized protein (TIGR03546 family)